MASHPRRTARGSAELTGSPLVDLHRFVLPFPIVNDTIEVLRGAARSGTEAFVLWGGVVESDELLIRSMLVPRQVGHITDAGLLVTVDGDALFEANRALYQRGEILAAQVHSHPTDAFHSDTDDCYPLVTLAGALSAVVPNFGRDGIAAMSEWAWYRLTGEAAWRALGPADHITVLRPET